MDPTLGRSPWPLCSPLSSESVERGRVATKAEKVCQTSLSFWEEIVHEIGGRRRGIWKRGPNASLPCAHVFQPALSKDSHTKKNAVSCGGMRALLEIF